MPPSFPLFFPVSSLGSSLQPHCALDSELSRPRSPILTLLSTTKLGPSLAPSGPRFLPSEEWVELPLLARRAASRQPGLQQQGRRAGPPCPSEAGGGPPPAAAPQSPVNLLARLEPAAIWSDGLFMEPGGGGPGPDLANLEAISSPRAGSVWSSHQQVGTTPSSPHTLHHPEPRPLWGSLRSPVSCRALQFGPAPSSRALKTRRDWATHTGQDEGVGGEGGGGECRGLPGREPQAELLSGMFGFEYTYKRTEETHMEFSTEGVKA